MKIRKAVSGDRSRVLNITEGVGNFTEEEVKIAMEVFDQSCDGTDEYLTLCIVDDNDGVTGYAACGLIPLTKSSYDLYWIAVDRDRQHSGRGKILLDHVEREIVARGGTRLFIETSSEKDYAESRRFYERRGYGPVATIRDFYWEGNDKVIYVKEMERRSDD